jgi:hypothetical protein
MHQKLGGTQGVWRDGCTPPAGCAMFVQIVLEVIPGCLVPDRRVKPQVWCTEGEPLSTYFIKEANEFLQCRAAQMNYAILVFSAAIKPVES